MFKIKSPLRLETFINPVTVSNAQILIYVCVQVWSLRLGLKVSRMTINL